jgi:hypothetical protein
MPHFVVAFLSGFLASVVVGYAIGFWQGKTAQRTLGLSVHKASPRIGSRVTLSPPEIAKGGVNLRYFIHTTLYNEGDFSASKVQGTWTLNVSNAIQKAEKTIFMDSLPSFLPWEMNYELSGNLRLVQADPTIIIEVYIDLSYFGMDNKQETYHAEYRYDYQQRTMTQCRDESPPSG